MQDGRPVFPPAVLCYNTSFGINPNGDSMTQGKKIASVFIVVIVLATLPVFLSNCRKKPPEPNVVLIVIDTLRADHLSTYGYKKSTAPFIDSVAGQGIVFENAFSTSSWTAPATASIFTSLYPFQHGVLTGLAAGKSLKIEINSIPEEIETVTEVLKRNGYATFGISDNINICSAQGFTQGFDKFKRFPYPNNKKIDGLLEKWAEEIKSNKKYFLYLHFNDPHEPYHARDPWYEPKKSKLRDAIARYDSEIGHLDARIKTLYQTFGWDKNTLLIITSDHGEGFLEHKKIAHGNSLYSELIHVPLVIRFPGEDRAPRRISGNVSIMDILPTLRGYLELGDSTLDEGIDLTPVITGETPGPDQRYLFSHLVHRRWLGKGNIRKTIYHSTVFGNWKHIVTSRDGKIIKNELFDLEKDPLEKLNLFSGNREITNRLFARYRAFEKSCRKFQQAIKRLKLDNKQKKELKTLGYVQ